MNFAIEHPELQKSAFMEFPNMSPLSHHYSPYYQRCPVGAPRSEYNLPSYGSRMNFPLQVNHIGPPAPPTSHAYLPYVPRDIYEGKITQLSEKRLLRTTCLLTTPLLLTTIRSHMQVLPAIFLTFSTYPLLMHVVLNLYGASVIE